MIDLNNKEEFGTVGGIFNDGVAGTVENVTLTIVKKTSADHAQSPDYNLVANDGNGEVRQGFYYLPSNSETKSKEEVEKNQKMTVDRLLDVARTMVDKDFVFPATKSYQEAIDVVAGVIRDNSEGKLFKVFTTYGSRNYPREFLELRFFNSVLPQDSPRSFRPGQNDQMERIQPDAPSTGSSDDNWLAGDAPATGGATDDGDGWIG